MDGQDEIELKLQADSLALARVLADPLFTDPAPVTRLLVSTYHDTARRDLREAGLSLRVRRVDERYVQTVKAAGDAAGGLSARPEWERDVPGEAPVLDDPPPPLAALLAGIDGRVPAPVFTMEVSRATVVHAIDGGRIELAADRGRIVAGERQAPIAEIELELIEGDPAALFALARRLCAHAPLRLGVRSKSERGYALLADADKERPSVKAEPIALPPDVDVATLFVAIAGACIRQFRLNEDKLLATGAPEALHQARVGLRRLRSALTIFSPALEGADHARFAAALRDLASALGQVRDIDAMIAKIEDEAALDALRAARTVRFRHVAERLEAPETPALMLDLAEWIAIGPWRTAAETAAIRAAPAADFAGETLDGLRDKLARRGRHLADLSEEKRHRARIAGKKLRYAAEFFSGLYPGRKAGRRREDFLVAIEDLQTALGHLNDLAQGRALLADLGIADAEHVLGRARKGDTSALLDEGRAAYKKLLAVKRFWR